MRHLERHEYREIRRRLISLGFRYDRYVPAYHAYLRHANVGAFFEDSEENYHIFSQGTWIAFTTVDELELAVIYHILRGVRRCGAKKRAAATAYLKETFLIGGSLCEEMTRS